MFPDSPYWESFLRRCLWSTVSNALAMSRYKISVCFHKFRFDEIPRRVGLCRIYLLRNHVVQHRQCCRSEVISDCKRDVSDVHHGAHSFSKRTGILSGPQDLLGTSLTSTLYTSVFFRLMSVISLFVAGINVLWFSSLSLKNTELKYLLNILADSFSEFETTRVGSVLPDGTETCDGIRLDLVDVLKNDQKSFGSEEMSSFREARKSHGLIFN